MNLSEFARDTLEQAAAAQRRGDLTALDQAANRLVCEGSDEDRAQILAVHVDPALRGGR